MESEKREIIRLTDALREKYGSDSAAARAVGVPRRTYTDWIKRGFTSQYRRNLILTFLRPHLSTVEGN